MKKLFFLIAASFFLTSVDAQITERERPAEWQHLVKGARFMDRFLPMPDGIQIKGIWGTDSVLNRYVDNGIELPGVSFWGGNILQDTDGKYHLFVCGWPEDSPKGHMFWSNSTVFHAVSDRLEGPFKIQNSVGKGHNPEAFQLKDGRVVVYVIDGYYIADGVDSKVWTYGKFSFDSRDRKIIEGLSNLTFARRQDDSYLMVCRGGGVWISKDGLSPYMQLTDKRVYPDVEYNVQVDMDRVQDASMVQFDMGSLVEVMVKKNNGTIHEVDIRPQVNDIRYVQYKNVITFMLDKPRYLSVEFNGDRLHNLHVFANPMETETYSKEEKGVMYFGPGVHRPKDLPNNQIRIPSNTTVYLAPGAVVKAKLWVDKAENVRIVGRGILDHPIRGIEITDSKNVVVDGITVINPDHYTVFGGGSVGVTIRNLKSFSCKGWSDGIDMMCCHDVLIDNVFMRNSDDCIALYNHRWNWWGGSDNITVQNSILWADIAHPINVGGHGDPESLIGETIENLIFRNIDILEHDEDDVPYQGCMAIDAGDRNRVKNILFEDIRVESIQEGKLFHINIRFNPKYDKQPGQSIDGVTFRNITYNGVGENPSLIKGLDKERMVRNITFENVVVNGEKIKDLKGFITNEYIEGIKIK